MLAVRQAREARFRHDALVGQGLFGLAMLAFELALARWSAARLKEQGRYRGRRGCGSFAQALPGSAWYCLSAG